MDFGEVVTTSSRAFWNDYEEFETIRPTSESLLLDYGSNTATDVAAQLASVDTLLAIEGHAIGNFVTEAILRKSARLLCTVANHKCTVHLLADTRTAVLLSSEQDLMSFGGIAELLVPLLGSIARVVTLNVEPSVTFKTAGGEADTKVSCFVRGLSSKEALASHVPVLAEPNMLTGVAVGIAAWRKFADLPWSSYVAYVSEPEMNSLTAAPILRLLRDLRIECSPTYTLKPIIDSNLYT